MDMNSSLGSPSNSPQPPPVFKSNKVTPAQKKLSQGRVNTYCEAIDDSDNSVELYKDVSGDEGSRGGDTDESSVAGVYDLQDERDKVMETHSHGTFELRRV